jgi:hypothetical protein
MRLERREFLMGFFGCMGALKASPGKLLAPGSRHGIILAPCRRLSTGQEWDHLHLIDANSGAVRSIQLPLHLSHSVVVNPVSRNVGVVFELAGPNACLVDLKKGKVIGDFRAQKGMYFNGHGIFTCDGKELLAPEYPIGQKSRGRIVVRSAATFKIKSSFSSKGYHPHEMIWGTGENELVIANYGLDPNYKESDLKSSLTFIDYSSRKLVKKVSSPQKNLWMCHLAMSNSGQLFVTAMNQLKIRGKEAEWHRATRDKYESRIKWPKIPTGYSAAASPALFFNSVSKASGNRVVKRLPDEISEKMVYPLSVSYNAARNVFGVAYKATNLVAFWSGDPPHNLVGKIYLKGENPKGICSETQGEGFWLSTRQGNLYRLAGKDFSSVRPSGAPKGAFKGNTHLLMI